MTLLPLFSIAFALLVAFGFGYFLAASILPVQLRRPFAWLLAPGIGVAFSSLIFFVFRRPMFTVEFIILFPICGVWLRRKPWRRALKPIDLSWRPPVLAVVFAGALGFAAAGLLLEVSRMPYGDWDGWNIWNSHARLLHRAGSNWTTLLPYTFHGDYPLLTSAVAARFWRYAGVEIPEAGALLGIVLFLSAVALLIFMLREFRDVSLAILFGFILLGTPNYLDLASDQFADVPLSFFILSTIALIFLYLEKQPHDSGLLGLAGFTAGCAAWTKNEGLLFVVATFIALIAALALRRAQAARHVGRFIAGALFPLIVVFIFKVTMAPQNDLIASSSYTTVQAIFNLERHTTILKYAGSTMWSFGIWSIPPLVPLFGVVALRGLDWRSLRSSGWLTGFAILLFMAVGYYSVYLMTPLDLDYHLKTSLDRLMIHLWPSFLLLLGLAARPL